MPRRLAGKERARIEREAVLEMNKTHAAVRVGGNVLVIAEDADSHVLMTFRALSDWLACKPLEVPEWDEKAGKMRMKRVDRAMLWRSHPDRRNVRGLEFAPGKDLGPEYYNLWKGWSIVALDDGGAAAAPILAHIKNLWCGGNESVNHWVVSWLAQMVQEPCKKPGTSLVLRGDEGTGKGIIAGQLMRRFMGPAFVQILNPGQVTGRFNSVWLSKLNVFVDESVWAGDKSAEGILKGLITEQKLVLEFKGKEAIEIDNLSRLIFATNAAWAVPVGPTGRRFCALDTSSAMRGNREYFQALAACVEGDGARSFFGYLQSYDYSGVDLRVPPVTAALMDQKILSLDSVAAWWRERLWAGFLDHPTMPMEPNGAATTWPDSVPCAVLYGSYMSHCKAKGVRYPEGEEGMAKKLREFAPIERKRGARDAEGYRPWRYTFGYDGVSLLHGLRGRFERWIGGALDWTGDDAADHPDHPDHEGNQVEHVGGDHAPF